MATAGRPAYLQSLFETNSVPCLDTNVGVHTEAGNHGAAGALEGLQNLSVNLISQTHDTAAGIATDGKLSTDGVGQQSRHPGIVL